jgi:hypothetical protein
MSGSISSIAMGGDGIGRLFFSGRWLEEDEEGWMITWNE